MSFLKFSNRYSPSHLMMVLSFLGLGMEPCTLATRFRSNSLTQPRKRTAISDWQRQLARTQILTVKYTFSVPFSESAVEQCHSVGTCSPIILTVRHEKRHPLQLICGATLWLKLDFGCTDLQRSAPRTTGLDGTFHSTKTEII